MFRPALVFSKKLCKLKYNKQSKIYNYDHTHNQNIPGPLIPPTKHRRTIFVETILICDKKESDLNLLKKKKIILLKHLHHLLETHEKNFEI